MSKSVFNLSEINGTNGIVINGTDSDDYLGTSVSNIGDINNDGIDDVVIGAPLANATNGLSSGKSYVIFGNQNGFNIPQNINELDGTNGFTLIGNVDSASGSSVSAAGDFNGDGIQDLLIGAPYAAPNGEKSGKSYVIFGRSDGFTGTVELENLGNNGVTLIGPNAGEQVGFAVSEAGDINGDGIGDVIIGATNNTELPDNGKVYVVFGNQNYSSTANLNLANLNGSNGFSITGLNAGDKLGYSVSSAGDINGDGFKDLIFGAPFADANGSNSGQVYVIYGTQNGFPGNFDLNNLNGSNGFTINGINAGDNLGFSVSDGGDINGDGVADFIIGARDVAANGNPFAGAAYVVFGNRNGFGNNLNLSTLNGSNGFVINGVASEDNAGISVSKAGDFNRDGFGDLIIGATGSDANGDLSGQSYVVFGKNNFNPALNLSQLDGNNGFAINGAAAGDISGLSVSTAGDLNGDGNVELIVGAPWADPNGVNRAGQAFVLLNDLTYGNYAPRAIHLSNANINEGIPAASEVGLLSTNDPNLGDSFTYTLVGGDGSQDNSAFSINQERLIINQSPDYETKSSYNIRLRTTDKVGNYYEEALTINVVDRPDQTPTDITLSNFSLNENVAAGTEVGILNTNDPDQGDTFTYTLVDGEGSQDNSAFTINSDRLLINQSPNFEAKSSYNIRIRTTDSGGQSYEKTLTININDINEAPTSIGLSTDVTIDDDTTPGTEVGILNNDDPDNGENFTYQLVDGEGSQDNSAFSIVNGDRLVLNQTPNYANQPEYNIRVRTTDSANNSVEQPLTLYVDPSGSSQVFTSKLTQVGTDTFTLQSSTLKSRLQISLASSNSQFVNELGVFTVDDANGNINGIAPGADGYTAAALQRSTVVFSSLNNAPTGFNSSNMNRVIELNSNDNLRFYVIKNSTKDNVQAGITPLSEVIFSDSENQTITSLSNNAFSLAWNDGSLGSDTNNLVVNIQATGQAAPKGTTLQGQSQAELVDLRSITQAQQAEFIVNREAVYNNYISFYQVVDQNGGIDLNGDGIADILPGQADYIKAAVERRLSGIDLTVENQGTATFTANLQAGAIYAPFMIVNGTADAVLDSDASNDPFVFFSYLGANSDGRDHIRLLGDNTFGFEDLFGGGDGDFNDAVVKVNLSSVV